MHSLINVYLTHLAVMFFMSNRRRDYTHIFIDVDRVSVDSTWVLINCVMDVHQRPDLYENRCELGEAFYTSSGGHPQQKDETHRSIVHCRNRWSSSSLASLTTGRKIS